MASKNKINSAGKIRVSVLPKSKEQDWPKSRIVRVDYEHDFPETSAEVRYNFAKSRFEWRGVKGERLSDVWEPMKFGEFFGTRSVEECAPLSDLRKIAEALVKVFND